MVLIFGGAHQGKSRVAQEKYGIQYDQIMCCEMLDDIFNSDELYVSNARSNQDKLFNSDVTSYIDKRTNTICEAVCVDHFERWILTVIKAGDKSPSDVLKKKIDSGEFNADIVIMDDITQGVVPVDTMMRKWRDEVGRCLQILAENSNEVVKVFAGICEVLKSNSKE